MKNFEAHRPILTPEQVEQLEAGPGIVNNPAEMTSVERLTTFNNFYLHFDDKGFGGSIYQRLPWAQRFSIIYPVFNARLCEEIDRLKNADPAGYWYPDEAIEMRLAYSLMSNLVDGDDLYVIRPDGSVERDMLVM